MRRLHRRRSSDWLNFTLSSSRKKVNLGHSHKHNSPTLPFSVLTDDSLSSEEKKAEEASFETELIAGRLQEEVVRNFFCESNLLKWQ